MFSITKLSRKSASYNELPTHGWVLSAVHMKYVLICKLPNDSHKPEVLWFVGLRFGRPFSQFWRTWQA